MIFPLSNLLDGTKRFFVGLQGQKFDGTTMETIKTNDDGALKVSAELTGNIIVNETDKVVTENTNILTNYIPTKTGNSVLMIASNSAGILKLSVDNLVQNLNGGSIVLIDTWYAFEFPMLTGGIYNLQFSVNATMQIKWIER